MSTKVSPQSTIIDVDRSGKRVVRLLNSTPEGWKKSMWKEARIMEACLYGETVSVALALSTCLKLSRKAFVKEIAYVRDCVEACDTRVLPTVISPPLLAKHSQSALLPIQYKATNVTHRSVIRNSVSLLDWKAKMLEMMLDSNRDTQRAVFQFLSDYKARQITPKRHPTDHIKPLKPDRVKMYETYGACNPYTRSENSEKTDLFNPTVALCVFADIKNDWFSTSSSLEFRLKVLNSIRKIQKKYRKMLENRRVENAIKLQKWVRMTLARRVVVDMKIARFRKVYYAARLKHWLKLLANKWKIRKLMKLPVEFSRFLGEMPKILMIQNLIRRFVMKNRLIPHLKSLNLIRKAHKMSRIRAIKASLWLETRPNDDNILKNALAVAEQVQYFQQTMQQGRKIKGFKTDKDLRLYIRSMEKAENRDRRQQTLALEEVRKRHLYSVD